MENITTAKNPFLYQYEQSVVAKSTFTNIGFDDHELEDLVERGILKLVQNGKYTLRFVGVLIPQIPFDTKAIIVLPKYLKSIELNSHKMEAHLGLILNALESYRSSKRQIEVDDHLFFPSNFGAESSNGLALADFFIKDFLKHGIYRKSRTVYQTNSNGRIDWKRTIDRQVPLISRNTVVYTSTIHKRTEFTNESDVSTFHKYVVSKLIQMYGGVLGYSLHPNIPGQVENLEMMQQQVLEKKTSTLWQKLNKELRQTYGHRNITLIRNLMNFIEPSYSSSNSMLVMGTKNFEKIWEEILLRYLDSNGTTSSINDNFPSAEWWNLEHKPISNAPRGKPITDTVAKVSDDKYIIADAKYYDFDYDEITCSFNGKGPGFNDIQKQVFYEKLLMSIKGDVECANILIYPRYELEDDCILKPFGTVNIPVEGLPFIVNFFGNSEKLLQYYTRSVNATNSDLASLFKVSRKNSHIAFSHSNLSNHV